MYGRITGYISSFTGYGYAKLQLHCFRLASARSTVDLGDNFSRAVNSTVRIKYIRSCMQGYMAGGSILNRKYIRAKKDDIPNPESLPRILDTIP